MIGGNGSYVEHHGQVFMHQLISKEKMQLEDCGLADRRHLAFIWRAIMASLPVLIFRSGRVRHKTYAIQRGNLQILWR